MRLLHRIKILPLLITLALFFIPFFWLKPGEMDLGGDSSRLYFYQPLAYLKSFLLYNIVSSGIGGSIVSYFAIPYILLLVGLRMIFSPTVLIDISQGMKLSIGFISSYLIVKELLSNDKKIFDQHMINISSIVSGLFYIFSPIIVNSGWDRAILTHTQIFIYPLIFYLLLRYLITHTSWYLLSILLVSYIFSINFSFIAAPGFFAFFPLSLIYLLFYVRCIRHISLPWKGMIGGVILFLIIQSFHVIPHILGLFVSKEYAGVFSQESIIVRGLDYFLAIAPSVKVSIGFFNLAQLRNITLLSFGSIIFPFILVGGLLNKKKEEKPYLLYLTIGIFFITLFFETANITHIGFLTYRSLFFVPGFKMFRNFFAQWSMVFAFYYTLVIGLSLPRILHAVRKVFQLFIVGFILIDLFLGAYPLLNGSMVNAIQYKTKNVKQNIRIDPIFEQMVGYIRSLPIDGKILSLPLVGPGYQVVAGINGGVYMGPSFFTLLAGRNDFTGYDGLGPFGQVFLDAAGSNRWQSMQRLFSLLNIKYVFYNSDPNVYEKNFPNFPYDYVIKYMPKTQDQYKKFIQKLSLDTSDVREVGPYALYSVTDDHYLPHIFASNTPIFTNRPDTFSLNEQMYPRTQDVVLSTQNTSQTTHNVVFEAEPLNPFSKLKDNMHLHKHSPYLSVDLNAVQYPFVVLKERIDLIRASRDYKRFFDVSFFLLTKRVFELDRWGNSTPVLHRSIHAPRIQDFYKISRYDSWEASLARYEDQSSMILQKIIDANPSDALREIDKIKAKEQFDQHRRQLLFIFKESRLKEDDIVYLRELVEAMFQRVYQKLNLKIHDMSLSYYTLSIPQGNAGEYETLVQFDDSDPASHLPYELTINDQTLTKVSIDTQRKIGIFNDTFKSNGGATNIVMRVNSGKIISDESWINSGFGRAKNGIHTLSLIDISSDYVNGLIKEIPEWQGNKQYMITFDYNTHGDYFLYRFFDKQLVNQEMGTLKTNVFFEKNLHSEDWQTQQALISANEISKSAYLQFLIESDKKSATMDIRNLSVVQIDSPHIFLKKKTLETVSKSDPPSIVFRKINPTKYQVDVSGAANPYVLVFLEAFDNHWQLTDAQKRDGRIVPRFMKFLGIFYTQLSTRMGASYSSKDEIIATHFNGRVREGKHTYSFLDPRNFVSWGNVAIANGRHVHAYGYANAWMIQPDDMNNQTNYTFYIEMSNQKYFYIFLLCSGIGIAVIIGWMVYLVYYKFHYAPRT